MTKTSEVLTYAMALIDTPEKWARNVYSRTGKLCIQQAIYKATEKLGSPYGVYAADNAFRRAIGGWSVGLWNDHPDRTHAEVMAAGRRAIAAEQAKEATQ